MAKNNPTNIIVHHTAVSRTKNDAQINATNNYHKSQDFPLSSLGFYVGYHALIEPNGMVYVTRKDTESGAHTSQNSMNFNSIGVCLTGDFDVEEPTIEQCKALLQYIKAKQAGYRIPNTKVVPHRTYAPKTCWGKKLPDDIVGYLEKRVAEVTKPVIPEVSPEAKEAWEKAKKKGMISDTTNPLAFMDIITFQHMLANVGVMQVPTSADKETQWFVLALNRLKAFDNLPDKK